MSLYVPWWNNDYMKATHKCIQSIIPRARNAVFKETNDQGDLEYENENFDAPRPNDEFGQIGITTGDSGSPFTYKENGVYYLIAIQSSVINTIDLPPGYHTNNPVKRCAGIATKVTDDIIRWARQF